MRLTAVGVAVRAAVRALKDVVRGVVGVPGPGRAATDIAATIATIVALDDVGWTVIFVLISPSPSPGALVSVSQALVVMASRLVQLMPALAASIRTPIPQSSVPPTTATVAAAVTAAAVP